MPTQSVRLPEPLDVGDARIRVHGRGVRARSPCWRRGDDPEVRPQPGRALVDPVEVPGDERVDASVEVPVVVLRVDGSAVDVRVDDSVLVVLIDDSVVGVGAADRWVVVAEVDGSVAGLVVVPRIVDSPVPDSVPPQAAVANTGGQRRRADFTVCHDSQVRSPAPRRLSAAAGGLSTVMRRARMSRVSGLSRPCATTL
ncbi:hypothetical protein [Nannocystis punicea]|uniref:Uncharacterized protein n=1 Tax=Nannocystis punicea TaxID=2995304 RepID=A0ABY7GS28_9BACT|nr:hypothetical protein [Nannocystis poenicansa]WAS89731.1 hypothetical protein O0S08_26360 [Nannocystis poenicansa]